MRSLSFIQIEEEEEVVSKPALKLVTEEHSFKNPVNFFQIEEIVTESKPRLRLVEDDYVEREPVRFLEISELTEAFEKKGQVTAKSDVYLRDNKKALTTLRPHGLQNSSKEGSDSVATTKEQFKPKPNVMIIEDDMVVSGFLRHLFNKHGYETHYANDGKKAINMISEINPPDLIIMDIMLPFKDGYQILKSIRSNETWSNVPVMVLTSKGKEQDIVRAFSAGANDYLKKPFQSQELMARAERLVA